MAEIKRIPFSELVERVQKELVRDASAAEGKYKSRVNDEYTTAIPSEIDYRHIKKTGSVTTWADYSTGTVALVNGSADITGTSTVWNTGGDAGWVAGTDTMLFKAGNYDEVYRLTYVGATSATLDRNWVEATDTSESYVIYQERYALATDFERMTDESDQCVYYWRNGIKVYLKYEDWTEFQDKQTHVVGTPYRYTVKWVNDDPYLYVNCPPTDVMTIGYDYIPSLARMAEYTTGSIKTLANASTAVVSNAGTDFDGFLSDFTTYSYYFRIDGDGTGGASVWYKIASATDNTNIVLSDAYAGTAIVAGTSAYTISKVSLLPAGLDIAIMYGAALNSAVDQSSEIQIKSWASIYRTAVDRFKRIESNRGAGKQRMRTIYEKAGVRR